jgi:hypothetical protein
MNRSLVIFLGALALGAAIFAGSCLLGRHVCENCMSSSGDDLNWLRLEFHLSDADMARIRQLHEGYLPKCAEMCAKIAAAKRELDSLVGTGTNLTAEAQAKLNEIASLRAQCQSNMIQHFVAVSQAMSPEQGACYLTEMKKLTLGTNELMEQSMSGDTGHEHHH